MQIISLHEARSGAGGARSFSFTFDTPPFYTDQFTTNREEEEEWTADELILLFTTRVDLLVGPSVFLAPLHGS